MLGALADTEVRHRASSRPATTPSVIGAPFILMDRVDGITPIDPLPAPFDHDFDQPRAGHRDRRCAG